jgi:hypothetical protein
MPREQLIKENGNMKPFKSYLITATGIALLAVTVSVVGSRPVGAQTGKGPQAPQPVTISSPIPLPVTGTVGLTGTSNVNITNSSIPITGSTTVSGTVAATQSGSWSVGLSGTPSVNVANSSIPVTGTVGLSGTPSVNVANSSIPVTGTVGIGNTNSNPVQTVDVEKLARIPYQSSYRTTTCTNVTNCFFSFTAAPQGYRLVVENLSGLFELNNAATAPATGLIEGSNFLNVFAFTSTNGQIFNGTIMSGINIPVRMVFDSSEGNPVAFVYGDYPSIQGLPSTMTLSGYLENCTVTGCPTIQR